MGVSAEGPLADYRAAAALFGEQLNQVADDDWANPTPCDEWDVRTLVAHVVIGEALVAGLFRGDGDSVSVEVDTSVLGPSPMSTWRGTVLAALEAAGGDGVLDATHAYPNGDLAGSVIVGFRTTDNLVHAWDLARACGRDLDLPDDVAGRCLDFWLQLADVMAVGGVRGPHFAPPVLPADDAPAGLRLLALLGRSA